jgi:hypothetical protein
VCACVCACVCQCVSVAGGKAARGKDICRNETCGVCLCFAESGFAQHRQRSAAACAGRRRCCGQLSRWFRRRERPTTQTLLCRQIREHMCDGPCCSGGESAGSAWPRAHARGVLGDPGPMLLSNTAPACALWSRKTTCVLGLVRVYWVVPNPRPSYDIAAMLPLHVMHESRWRMGRATPGRISHTVCCTACVACRTSQMRRSARFAGSFSRQSLRPRRTAPLLGYLPCCIATPRHATSTRRRCESLRCLAGD